MNLNCLSNYFPSRGQQATAGSRYRIFKAFWPIGFSLCDACVCPHPSFLLFLVDLIVINCLVL